MTGVGASAGKGQPDVHGSAWRRVRGPEAKVRFWVVEAGGSAQWSREATQKVSLTLTPVDEHGQAIHIVDRVAEPPP